jgi:ligand-binding sensor domain-containing protein/two-component sensor histidine kinase
MFFNSPLSARLILLLLCVPLSSLRAQILPFHSYTAKDGLISNNINTIYQDSRGYMWFGTTDGMSVFDGRTFTNYSSHDGLPHNFINSIFEDRISPGKMWLLAGNQVCRFTRGKIYTYPLHGSSIGSIYQDREGTIWCGTDHGLIKIKDDNITYFRPALLDTGIEFIAEVDDSLLWFASEDHRLVCYSRETQTFTSIDISQYGQATLWSMFGDHEGSLWVGMGDNYVLRIRGRDSVTSRRFWGSTSWLIDDGKGILWLGGYSGIGSIPKKQFEVGQCISFTTENGLPENTIRSLCVDREKNLWIGGRDKGIAKLSTVCTISFEIGAPSEFGLAHGLPYAASDSSGHIWAYTENGLQEFWRDAYGHWQRFTHIPGPTSRANWFSCLLQISHGRLWIDRAYLNTTPSHHRLKCYIITPDPGGGHSHLAAGQTIPPEFPPSTGLAIIVGQNGTICQSIWMKGIAYWDPLQKSGGVRIFGEKDGVPTNFVRTLCMDHLGNVWGGTFQDGLVRVSPHDTSSGLVKRYTPANGLPDWGIWSIMEDRSGDILVGTSYGGLAIIRGDSITTISDKEGLPSNAVYCMTEDSYGRLWLGTQIGMVYEDSPGSKRFLENQAFIGSGVHCCGTTKDGFLWFVTPKDLWIYDYIHDVKDTIPPPAYITSVKVNGNLQAERSDLRFSYDENNCEFDFIGISFRDEQAIRYQHRLLGLEQEWHQPKDQNSITYASLSPGSYKFEVKAINVDGIESVTPALFTFIIVPPFWQRWWFYLLVAGTIASVLFILYRYRVGKLLELERVRIRIASDLHDDVGSTLTKISLQSELLERMLTSVDMKSSVIRIGTMSREVVSTMGDLVWSIDARNDNVGNLIDRMKDFASSTLSTKEISVEFTIQGLDGQKSLPVDVRQSIYLVFKEAMTNIAKHAEASAVRVFLMNDSKQFMMKIVDNGKSKFGVLKLTGHGLKNMQMRAEQIGGRFEAKDENGFAITMTTKPL